MCSDEQSMYYRMNVTVSGVEVDSCYFVNGKKTEASNKEPQNGQEQNKTYENIKTKNSSTQTVDNSKPTNHIQETEQLQLCEDQNATDVNMNDNGNIQSATKNAAMPHLR